MKYIICFILSLGVISSCSNNANQEDIPKNKLENISNIIEIQLENSPSIESCYNTSCLWKITLDDGSIVVSERGYDTVKFPEKIFTGILDEGKWFNLIKDLDEGNFSELDETGNFPPGYPTEKLKIIRDGKESVYIYRYDRKKSPIMENLLYTINDLKNNLLLENSGNILEVNQITSIEWGTSFGMCGGYCMHYTLFTSGSVEHIQQSYDEKRDPKKITTYSLSTSDWNSLLTDIDWEKIEALPERFGCPDCADGGAEWINITRNGVSKKVLFDYGKAPPEIENLVKNTRKISEELYNQNTDESEKEIQLKN